MFSAFKAGDVMFREGEPASTVLFVTRGAIEISTEVGGRAVLLGTVGEGQFVGEMAAIEGRAHSATARAACDGAAEIIDAQAFLERVSREPPLAHQLIARLSVRLREADRAIAVYRAAGSPPPFPDASDKSAPVETISISANSAALRAQMGEAPMLVASLPFVVGRTPEFGEHHPQRRPDLSLRDREPMRLSRNHFAIERHQDRLVVRDLASTLGAEVNGRAIGRHFPSDSADLRAGDNAIVAGGEDSPFEFTVTVGAAVSP